MGTRFTTIRIPSCSEVYVFGSALHSATPNDLDIVAIYDDSLCLPSEAYQRHAEMVSDLKQTLGLPVHLTLLTSSEEIGVSFIERTDAIPIVQAQRANLTFERDCRARVLGVWSSIVAFLNT